MLERLAPIVALPALALALSACGSSSRASASGDDSAATIAPASTPVFVSVDTDTSSDQLKSGDALLKKFPARAQLLEQIRTSAQQNGISLTEVARAIGPETDIAILDVKKGSTIGYTKPKDEKAFDKLLEAGKDPLVHTKIHGWTVFSDKQADLELAKHADGKLSDEQPYKDAMSSLPDTAIAKAFVARSAIKQGFKGLQQVASASGAISGFDKADWISAAAFSHDEGVELQLHAHGKQVVAKTKTYTATFADKIPSDALLAISFNGAGNQLDQVQSGSVPQLRAVEQALGVKIADVQQLLGGEGAIYLRAGNPIPEVTILAKQDDEQKAERTLDRIVAKVGRGVAKPQSTTVDGVALKQLSLGPVSILYGAFDGKLVVTDSGNAIRELKSSNDKLVDSTTFKDAQHAAGMPDKTTGWVYANLKDAVPVIESLSKLAGGSLPSNVDANLKPLRSLLVFGTTKGDTASAVVFLQTN